MTPGSAADNPDQRRGVEAPLKRENAYHTLPLAEDTIGVLESQRKKTGGRTWVLPSPVVVRSPRTTCRICSIGFRVCERAAQDLFQYS